MESTIKLFRQEVAIEFKTCLMLVGPDDPSGSKDAPALENYVCFYRERTWHGNMRATGRNIPDSNLIGAIYREKLGGH